jgi:hypothetical protein
LCAIFSTDLQILEVFATQLIATHGAILRTIEDVLVAAADVVTTLGAINWARVRIFNATTLVVTTISRTITRTGVE